MVLLPSLFFHTVSSWTVKSEISPGTKLYLEDLLNGGYFQYHICHRWKATYMDEYCVQSSHCFIDLELPREEHNICISPPSVEFCIQMSELAECVKPQPGSQLPGDHTSEETPLPCWFQHGILALLKQVTAALVCSAALLHTPETQDRKIPPLGKPSPFSF